MTDASVLVGIDFQEKTPVFVYRTSDDADPPFHYSAWRKTPPSIWLAQASRHLEMLLDPKDEEVSVRARLSDSSDDDEEEEDSVTLGEAINCVQGLKDVNLHERRASDEAGSRAGGDCSPRRLPPKRKNVKNKSTLKRRAMLLSLAWVQLAHHLQQRADEEECMRMAASELPMTLERLQSECTLNEDQYSLLKRMDNINLELDPKHVLSILDPGAAILYAHLRKRTSLVVALIQRCIRKNLDVTAWHWYAASHMLDMDMYSSCGPWAASILKCTLLLQRPDHFARLRKALSSYALVPISDMSHALLASGDADLARGVSLSVAENPAAAVQLLCGAIRGHHSAIFKLILQDMTKLNTSQTSRIGAEMRYASALGMMRDAGVASTDPLAIFSREGFCENVWIPLRLWDWTSVVRALLHCESDTNVGVWEELLRTAEHHIAQWPPRHVLARKISQPSSQSDRSSIRRVASERLISPRSRSSSSIVLSLPKRRSSQQSDEDNNNSHKKKHKKRHSDDSHSLGF